MMDFAAEFIDEVRAQLGDESNDLLRSLDTPASISVRLNPEKSRRVRSDMLPQGDRVPWCAEGVYLDSRPKFTLDPLLHAGAYYVQEASSMFLAHVVRSLLPSDKPLVALDACAAPGGKSTLLHATLPVDSLVVSNEYVRQRAHVLAENIAKWGYRNAVVTNNAVGDFARERDMFDLIVVDAPCSGEGMFRKEPEALKQWSMRNVTLCAERQRQILTDVLPALKENGLLVYSTCTFNRKEDEEIALFAEQSFGMTEQIVDVSETWGVVRGERGYHFYPHRLRGEGLYMVVFRKEGDTVGGSSDESRRLGKSNVSTHDLPTEWLDDVSCYEFENVSDRLVALPRLHAQKMRRLAFGKNALLVGVEVGVRKGKKLIPSTALALSAALSEGVEKIDLNLETALRYLRREAISLPAPTRKGYVVASYEGLPLGWLKNLGNRANNLYPEYWRIRNM